MLHRSTFPSKAIHILLLALCIAVVPMGTSSQAFYPEGPAAPTETIIDSNITTDTTWTAANSPYHVTEEVYVMPGVTLTIEPGVTVWIGDGLKIHVGNESGGATLIAKGTPSQPISFDRYIDPETGKGPRWKKIHLHPNSTSYFRYAEFAYGGASSNESTILHYEGPGTHVLNNCAVRKSKLQGIVAQGGSLDLTVAGTVFEDNGRRSLQVDTGASVTITGSTIDTGDRIAIYLRDRDGTPSTIIVNDSNILSDGSNFAVYNEMPDTAAINAEDNWWGDPDGPDSSSVTAGVDYDPWRTSEAPLVGITTPPVATFTVSPDPTVAQPPGTVYTFDASGCTDDEDYMASLEVCWDWENSGYCDTYTTEKVTTHSFDAASGASQIVRLVVRDTDGLTSEATREIVLNSPPSALFTVSPDPNTARPAGTVYTFDASASWDKEDPKSSLQVCWDWNNDGACDTTYTVDKTAEHSFTNDDVPEQTVRLVVRDTGGATGETTKVVKVLANQPPTAVFTFSQPTWDQAGARVDFDASGSTDDFNDPSELQVAWDYEGDGEHAAYSYDKTASYTYTHLGRYWPTLYVKDTTDLVGTLRRALDVIPPATGPLTLTVDDRTLESADKSVMVEVAPDTGGTLLLPEYGMVITYTPWLTCPYGTMPPGAFLYQGFNLSARSLADGQPIDEVTPPYTITVSYDYDYLAKVLHLSFEDNIALYRWDDTGTTPSWALVTATLKAAEDQLVATTSFLGDFALTMETQSIYLPLVIKNH